MWSKFAKLAAVAVVAAVVTAAPVSAADLIVKYDQSQIIRLDRPVAEIIIGNSTIADVSVQAPQMLVVTGKTFGITNVIILDASRQTIAEHRIIVQRDEVNIVTLHAAAKRQSYNCTPRCNPSLVVGDDLNYFETVAKVSERKIKFSEGANDASGGGQ
ncbi:MAG TPA: pilus assembly protein N-terminal domain-containing protein [Hyphomicrobiaceae bacterium]|nr:pilus assembly protein N-terminal domain-containing protein [Hyphomicrobiaceae bacterium]